MLDQLLKSSILPGPIGNLEEIGIERRQFTGTEVSGDVFASALFVEGVTLQVVGALAQYLAGLDVVLHDGLGPVFVDRADLHADGAAFVPRHHGPAALVNELVLFDAAPPDLLAHQSASGTTVNADLANLAKSVEAIVDGLVEVHRGVGGDDLESATGASMGSEQLAVGSQLA